MYVFVGEKLVKNVEIIARDVLFCIFFVSGILYPYISFVNCGQPWHFTVFLIITYF